MPVHTPSLVRLTYAVVNAVVPGLGARWATDVFTRTRSAGFRPDNVLPLGARAFEITGDPYVSGGYLWGGGGPVALLVHGWGVDSSSMQPLVPPLRDRGFTVAAFDAPGHGVSSGKRVTVKEYADAVTAAVRTLGGVRVVVAHSLGSLAAARGLEQAGHTPDCAVLIAPACSLSGVLDRWAPTELTATRPVVERVTRELHRRSGVPVDAWDLSTPGNGIGCPILALHDPADPVVPFGDAEGIAAAMPDVRVVPVPGRGHLEILTAPEVKAAAAAFVAEHATKTEGLIS